MKMDIYVRYTIKNETTPDPLNPSLITSEENSVSKNAKNIELEKTMDTLKSMINEIPNNATYIEIWASQNFDDGILSQVAKY